MIEKITSFLHVAPLFVILTIVIGSRVYQRFANRKTDFLSTILMLSAIGVASGFGAHHHNHLNEGFSVSCYLCIGYALILAATGLKISRDKSKYTKHSISI